MPQSFWQGSTGSWPKRRQQHTSPSWEDPWKPWCVWKSSIKAGIFCPDLSNLPRKSCQAFIASSVRTTAMRLTLMGWTTGNSCASGWRAWTSSCVDSRRRGHKTSCLRDQLTMSRPGIRADHGVLGSSVVWMIWYRWDDCCLQKQWQCPPCIAALNHKHLCYLNSMAYCALLIGSFLHLPL